MKFFQSKTIGKKLADQLLEQNNHFLSLYDLFKELPQNLSVWFVRRLNTNLGTRYFVEVDVAHTTLANHIYPGDLVISKNRDPKVGDLIEMAQPNGEKDYKILYAKVLSVDLKHERLRVSHHYDKTLSTTILLDQVLSIIDRIIPYNSKDWKTTAELFDLDVDTKILLHCAEKDLEDIEYSKNFVNKEENLALLKDRAKELER